MFDRVSALAGLAAVLIAVPALANESGSAWTRGGARVQPTGSFDSAAPPAPVEPIAPTPIVYAPSYENPGGILNEVRVGVLGFWQQNAESEEGVYVTSQMLFDPFTRPFENWILDILLRPRPHIGGTASADGTDQLFAGLTWSIPFGRFVFAEASFGGTIHDGPLENAEVALGCRVLFRESAALGANLGEHWRVLAMVEHSSHAELCGQDNDGLTHIGGLVGYRF